MRKELDLYTELNNNHLWLMEGKITSCEAREALECVIAYINEMPDGEKKNVLTEKAAALNAMLNTTYVFWCKNGSYFKEDDNVLANECRSNGVLYGITTNPLAAVQAVWKKKGLKDDPFFPVDYFVA